EDLAERAAEDGEVLREDEDLPAEDRPVAGDDGVPIGAPLEHAEVRLAMADVAIELDERPRIAEALRPLPRKQLPRFVLLLDCALRAGVERLLAELLQPGESLLGRLVCVGHLAAEPNAARRAGAPRLPGIGGFAAPSRSQL